jgi:hypothetical protein
LVPGDRGRNALPAIGLVSGSAWRHDAAMSETHAERRPLQIPCTLEVPGAIPLYGQTRELSDREASLQSANLAVPNIRKPKTGDAGVLTLSARGHLAQREPLKIPCRVAHVIGTIVGVQLNLVGLNSRQRATFAALLGSER